MPQKSKHSNQHCKKYLTNVQHLNLHITCAKPRFQNFKAYYKLDEIERFFYK